MEKEKALSLVAIHPEWFLRLWPWMNREPAPDFLTEGVVGQIAVGDGWYEILKTLFTKLEELSKAKPEEMEDFCLHQIKEKFGGLRVYTSKDGTEEVYNLTAAAEAASFRTCEFCGETATVQALSGRNWLKCICDSCNKDRGPKE